MVKFLSIVVGIVLILKFGGDYLASEKFQEYGDKNKAEWTCHVNKTMAELAYMLSNYDRAFYLHDQNRKRCEKKKIGFESHYRLGDIMRAKGRVKEAVALYNEFAELYPETALGQKAKKRADVLR